MKFKTVESIKELEALSKYNPLIPTIFTTNPQNIADWAYTRLTTIPSYLMFVRINVCTWNMFVVHSAVQWYVGMRVPVVLTFMNIEKDDIPPAYLDNYEYDETIASWRIKTSTWLRIMARFQRDPMVYSCGKPGLTTACKQCGNCLREYSNVKEKLNGNC